MKTKLEIGLAIVVLILGTFLVIEEVRKYEANREAEIQAKADKTASDKIDAALKQRDDQYKHDLADMQAKYEALAKMSSQDVVAKAQPYLQLPQPIVVSPETKPQVVDKGSAVVPEVDIKPLATAILDGEQCKLDRAKCQADLGDLQQKEKLTEDQAAQWKTAAKGGSVWKRVKKDAIILGIGAAAGYLAHR